MKAIILAGGFGKRLRPLTDTTPKPMLRVAGKPILEWQMEWLRRAGADEFVLCVGHLSHKVMEYFGDGSALGLRVAYVVEEVPLGTAGALRNALPHFPKREEDVFFTLNGDVLTDLDVAQTLKSSQKPGTIGALSLTTLPSPYGTVVTAPDGHVREFREKPRLLDHWINAGVYCLRPSIAEYLPQRGSLETDVFPRLAQEGKLLAVRYSDCFWMSIDSPKDIEEAEKALSAPRVASV